MICAMVNQLTKNATLKELEEAGLSSYYDDHHKSIYLVDASGYTNIIKVRDIKPFFKINWIILVNLK